MNLRLWTLGHAIVYPVMENIARATKIIGIFRLIQLGSVAGKPRIGVIVVGIATVRGAASVIDNVDRDILADLRHLCVIIMARPVPYPYHGRTSVPICHLLGTHLTCDPGPFRTGHLLDGKDFPFPVFKAFFEVPVPVPDDHQSRKPSFPGTFTVWQYGHNFRDHGAIPLIELCVGSVGIRDHGIP